MDNLNPFIINSTAKAPKIIPNIFCNINVADLPRNNAVNLEVKKIKTVKSKTMIIGKIFV